jgi:predicted ArsR family transcriptional regulator
MASSREILETGRTVCRGVSLMSDWGSDPEARRRLQRLVFRCASDYLLDEMGLLTGRHDGDVIRAVVHLALVQASADPGRGISIRALARSLNLPFETVRRKVRELEDNGLCVAAADGRPIAAPLDAAQARAEAVRVGDGFALLLGNLAALGVGATTFHGGQVAPAAADQEQARLDAHRLIHNYFLRTLEAGVGPHETMFNALIFAAAMSANAERITYDPDLAMRYAAADTPPPDGLRRPARPREIAERLNLPYEVVRRRLVEFHQRGWVAKVGSGYVCTVERMQQPELLAGAYMIVQRLGQLVQAVAQTGLIV